MRNNKKIKTMVLLAGAAAVLFFVFSTANNFGKNLSAIDTINYNKPEKSFAIIKIYGTIQGSNTGAARTGYDHNATINYIDELIEDKTNKGIFLDVSSGGGTVYHSDEMYLKLREYKEKTNRPISAYFNSMAASGAYYISASADYISANRSTWTGSIGVIMSMTNVKGLYDKLGIQEILITSGENKGMGSQGGELSEEQYAIYQGLVDESYELFVDIVATSRNMTTQEVKTLADGRVYTAVQAKENGLIDEIETYDEAIMKMNLLSKADEYYKPLYIPSWIETYFAEFSQSMPKSDTQVLQDTLNSELLGVPLYMYKAQ